VVETLSNKDQLVDNLKQRNARVSLDYLDANNRVNSQNVSLQDYEKIQKMLLDLQKENNNLRPKFQEMVLFKINAERKIHELKEDLIKNDIKDNQYALKAQSASSGGYGQRIQQLEGQLDSYKSREMEMSHKLESFKGKLDNASYSMGELRQEDLRQSQDGGSHKKSFNSRSRVND